jgi:D-alanyl-D-alanine endopeptidase (penicillin-binding protein 7)
MTIKEKSLMFVKIFLSLILIFSQNGAYFFDNQPFLALSDNNQPEQSLEVLGWRSGPTRIHRENIGVEVSADKYFAFDAASGKVLIEKDANIRQPLASITKLMTALVILENKPDWKKVVEMKEVDEIAGAEPHLYRGEQLTFTDLWQVALVSSDNNAIRAMVRSLGFTIPEFAEQMNAAAGNLKMLDSHFVEPTGLSPENLSTATDIARLLSAALAKKEIAETVKLNAYSFEILNTGKTRRVATTDILLDSFLNRSKYGYELVGGKTGFIREAGYCLAAAVKRGGQQILVVVLNSRTIDTRFSDVKILTDWIYSNYTWQ